MQNSFGATQSEIFYEASVKLYELSLLQSCMFVPYSRLVDRAVLQPLIFSYLVSDVMREVLEFTSLYWFETVVNACGLVPWWLNVGNLGD